MGKTVTVKIYWAEWKIPRIEYPGRYVAPAKFSQDDVIWSNDAWSMVLEFHENIEDLPGTCLGTAHFLAEDGPRQRLVSGDIFEMYEGKRLSAKVGIL